MGSAKKSNINHINQKKSLGFAWDSCNFFQPKKQTSEKNNNLTPFIDFAGVSTFYNWSPTRKWPPPPLGTQVLPYPRGNPNKDIIVIHSPTVCSFKGSTSSFVCQVTEKSSANFIRTPPPIMRSALLRELVMCHEQSKFNKRKQCFNHVQKPQRINQAEQQMFTLYTVTI